ncbi:MAG: hypothetical protein A3I44_00255 [Candidatus Sungbacteria bacterium RIFCSPLOWO2_02_FULL_51_17]|uniref:VWFA domain-containing protein n=1 Tax=Candidatus Sungbacteria bacterium RIFCSPHIGHO2_02_FULL_51_29 TaxID=1802273 RepID=A0A1G2KPI0_9BACT|nr:MAG: hypothetical protein A2676_04640 [Candidatus Sungbacteria bacterium RIFCSPHIGHO2_01_FULL_51_22]OHA01306.1 MAG: hypothetical protein A3C16_02060 [Candidatus Sungbacteria bacterium RIFCSPHIGHO2_02_FULL_51_29]OHA06465.1 MAG: hypothetical protein A3B29_05395 [Candidatus Sungbacteria bacterium RIFCSPLOWO2_01_FULL_51_34]OHA12527.1 MAG: hypothetical protein A3I44_00255 [Candidatus Sungbacteria bacterium RIFCSPLOWO2_02_FULL_51_17]
MGGGYWRDDDYKRSTRGTDAFKYSRDTLAKPEAEQKVHQMLNPYGLGVRESRDSAEHPESNAVMIGLDVTGSMRMVVVAIRDALGNLMDMLTTEKYILDPQLLFYAVGDATCDNVPFQVSQFESDNRINDQLSLVVLEGGGGGQDTESYELGYFTAARHTSIDCLEKRRRKGYLVSIGDERAYDKVSRRQVRALFNEDLQESISFEQSVAEAKEKYHLFHIIPKGSANYDRPALRDFWTRALGGSQFVFMLEDPKYTAETIGVAIGMNEGRITLEEGLAKVQKSAGQKAVRVVEKALAEFAEYAATLPRDTRAASTRKDAKAPDATDKKDQKKDKKSDWKL